MCRILASQARAANVRRIEEPRPVVVERLQTASGELVLRAFGDHHEIILNGVFLMDTRDGRSERALVREAIDGLDGARVLLGGLGVGFSLDEALASPRVEAVVVVEIEEAIVRWARTHLSAHGVDDRRTRVIVGDVAAHLRGPSNTYDVICLDVDNGPDWLSREPNAWLYGDAGLDCLRARVAPGGRVALWSSSASADVARRLEERIGPVRTVTMPVARGPDDVIYVATARA
jgi:spermidine synthase